MTAPLWSGRSWGAYKRLLPLLVAAYVVGAVAIVAPRITEPSGPMLAPVRDGALTPAQAYTLDIVKQLNSFLVSMTTLMFGSLGWYLSQYRSSIAPLTRAVFFSTVGFLALAFWYAAQTYAETVAELSQNVLGVTPGESRILFYLQLEFAVCAIAGVLILLVFADAVTRSESPLSKSGTQ